MGDDRIDVFGDLNSIGGLACGDLCDDCMLGGGGKFGRTSRKRCRSIGEEVLEYPGDSRLADSHSRGNETSRVAIRGQRKDVFLLSRRDGVHGGLKSIGDVDSA